MLERLIDTALHIATSTSLDIGYFTEFLPAGSEVQLPVPGSLHPVKTSHDHKRALEPFLGGRSRVSEVLNGKRRLSMRQIRKLHDGLNIPFEDLTGTN